MHLCMGLRTSPLIVCTLRGSTTFQLRALLRSFMDSDYVRTLANSRVGHTYSRLTRSIMHTLGTLLRMWLNVYCTDTIKSNFHYMPRYIHNQQMDVIIPLFNDLIKFPLARDINCANAIGNLNLKLFEI